MRVLNDLLGYDGLKIVQDTEFFSFSLDSVLLPNFVKIPKKSKNILDVGTGNAPIPLILTTKTDATITAIEVQKEIYEMAKETVDINNLSDKVKLINDDVNNIGNYYKCEFFDVILSNPPYFKITEMSKKNENIVKANARHEILLKLDQLIKIAFKYLKNDGVFAMVYRTDRLTDVLCTMRSNRIEPKRLTMIFPKAGVKSNLFLIEGIKNAKGGIMELNSLVVHDSNGNYTDSVLKYFK